MLEIERIDWSERRDHSPAQKPEGYVERGSFATHVPGGVARALASSPNAKVIHRISFNSADGRATRVSVISRDVALVVEITGQLLPSREVAVSVRVNLEVRPDPEPPFTTGIIAHAIRISDGESMITGGFLSEAEAKALQRMPETKDNPILQYLSSSMRGQPEEPEIVLMLTPRVTEWPDIQAVKPPKPELAPGSYTVQVAAFRNAKNADALLANLAKGYEMVFIEKTPAGRPFYQVRVGRVPDLKSARQLERQLRAIGFKPLVMKLTQRDHSLTT